MKRFLFSFLLLFSLSVLSAHAQKQTISVDTVYIQTLIDSCKGLYATLDAANAIVVGQNTLALIELSLPNAEVKTHRRLTAGKATLFRIIGNTYKDIMMDYPKALDYYRRCLKTAREIDDKVNTGGALFNTGSVYNELKEYKKALDYLNQSLKLFETIGHTGGIAVANSSIGLVYINLNQDSLALRCFQKSLNFYNEMQDTAGAAAQLNNMAEIYANQKRFSEALHNYQHSLKLYEAIGDSFDIAFSLAGIGNIYQEGEKNLKKAEEYFVRTLEIAKKSNLELEKEALKALKDLYHQQGRYKEAFDMYDRYILIKDSISIQQNAEEIRRREMQTDFDDKQARLQAEKEKQAAVAAVEHKRQRLIIWSVAGGLLLVVVFSIFILNRWRVTQRQKKIIEVQKAEVDKQRELADSRRIIAEEQKYVIEIQKTEVEKSKKIIEAHNKDITDSIHYASRIQRALLTSDEYIGKHLKEYFILFKPKDIVSGDFYWAFAAPPLPEEGNTGASLNPSSGGRGAGLFYLACCDCTGHGVPGAFMSLLNISFLNEALIEKELRDTDKILNDVRANVIRALNPDGKSEGKDGMDSVLCAIDFKNNILHASCANNPLWILQNGQINEIPPDKMPVGLHSTMEPFKENAVQLNKGDIIYAFSDGYADQFGGPKGKKFKYKQLEEVILANHHLPMKEQRDALEKTYDDWKGELEQVDDVLVIGVRI